MTTKTINILSFIALSAMAYGLMYLFIIKYDESLVLDRATATAAVQAERDAAVYQAEVLFAEQGDNIR